LRSKRDRWHFIRVHQHATYASTRGSSRPRNLAPRWCDRADTANSRRKLQRAATSMVDDGSDTQGIG
jgi:hypothetical protein